MSSTENNIDNKEDEISEEYESSTIGLHSNVNNIILDPDAVDVEVVNNSILNTDAEDVEVVINGDTHPDAENYRARSLSEVLVHMHERNMNRFRSVCNTGIISTLIFGGCVVYLTDIDYIRYEVGVPALGGIIAILIGFLFGLWRNK